VVGRRRWHWNGARAHGNYFGIICYSQRRWTPCEICGHVVFYVKTLLESNRPLQGPTKLRNSLSGETYLQYRGCGFIRMGGVFAGLGFNDVRLLQFLFPRMTIMDSDSVDGTDVPLTTCDCKESHFSYK
jgi:hypothetical protein